MKLAGAPRIVDPTHLSASIIDTQSWLGYQINLDANLFAQLLIEKA
jgi:hypothetical protein